MPQAIRKTLSPRLYTVRDLIELRRQILRFAQSLPGGPERNDPPTDCRIVEEPLQKQNVARHPYR
jgi:hypothetical protein